MSVSLKCQYGLRALFELAKRTGSGPTRIQEIAEAQAIPCLLYTSDAADD